MKKLKLSYIQGKSQRSVQKNLEYYTLKIKEASKSGAGLILLPELFLWDYFPITEDKRHFELALKIDSQEIRHFQDLAKKLNIILTLPIFEKAEDRYFNSVLLLNEQGVIIEHYRKMHIPYDPGFYEKFYFTPGNKGFSASDTSVGKIGTLICFDQWFPEAARILSLKGVQLITYPTAIGWDEKENVKEYADQLNAWITVMRAHAIANGVFVCAINRVGKEGHLVFWGNSFVCDPFGKIIISSDQEEDTKTCELDLDKIENTRKVWTFLRDRRQDQYSEILT